MVDMDELRGSIKLDGETVFFHHLGQDKDKLELYKKGLQEGKISLFDQSTLTRLRKMYYGFYSAIMFMFYLPTTFNNIGSRCELLSHALEDKDFTIVHGMTDSCREIPFFMYGVEHLDSNSWIEVTEGNTTWVYDLFSLMRIEKKLYYELEHPDVTAAYSKQRIMSHPARSHTDFTMASDGFNMILVKTIPEMERHMPKHPFRSILEPEISRYKKEIDFEQMVLDYKVFQKKGIWN